MGGVDRIHNVRRMRDLLCTGAQKPTNLLLYRLGTYPEPANKGLGDADQLRWQAIHTRHYGYSCCRLNPEFPDRVRCFDRPYTG